MIILHFHFKGEKKWCIKRFSLVDHYNYSLSLSNIVDGEILKLSFENTKF